MAAIPAFLATIPSWVGTAATVASTAVTAVGAAQANAATRASANYNADVAERDAAVADQNRRSAMTTARIAAEDRRRDNRRALSSIRASYGASGLDLAGSPLDVLLDSATEGELDAQRTEFEGRAQARSSALQMLGLRDDAALSRMSGRGSSLPVLGTLLGGAGTALQRTN